MNKKSNQIVRVAVALILGMAVSAPANAQLGGLKGLANKAKKAVNKVENTNGANPAAQAVAEATADPKAEYVNDIVSQNYLLNDLTDRNRQAKAVADYKAKVNAKINADIAPTKILGTYSTSPAWQGLPLFKYPDLQEKYSSVQEMQFKTFYEKDGKYYVLKSAFRQSIDKGDNVHGAQPQKDYWPGLEMPVEVPADKIKEYFK